MKLKLKTVELLEGYAHVYQVNCKAPMLSKLKDQILDSICEKEDGSWEGFLPFAFILRGLGKTAVVEESMDKNNKLTVKILLVNTASELK